MSGVETAERRGRVKVGVRPPHTVLVVDDDPDALLLLRTLFEHHGWRVLEAENGREALEAHAARSVDLIVTDLDMPVMDGLEMCRSLEGGGSSTSVIVVSGLDVDPEELCRQSTVESVFLKPVRMAELMRAASELVAR